MHWIEHAGAEPAVLCVHGYCQSSVYWAPTLERLAEAGIRCLAPDLPGFGASADPPGPYTMERYANALARLLDERALGRVMLVGGSMGGVVAQYFALRHAARVLRLVLVATGGATADPGAAFAKADALERGAWNEASVAPIVDGFFHRPPPFPHLDDYRRIALMASQAAAVEAARSNAHSRTLDRLGAINAPTLIIQGRHDRARTPEHGAEMCDRIPGARLEIIEEAGHTPQLEAPSAFHESAMPFLLRRS